MGAAKTIVNMFTYNQYLYYYINAKNIPMVEDILNKRPNLIKDPLTAVSKVTALNQAAFTNNIQLVQILIEKYHADVNYPSPKGETALISAIRRNHYEMVKFLLKKGADPNYIDKIGFKTIQYAILQGLYEISYLLYPLLKEKQLRTPQQYKQIGQKYAYRYVNYEVMIEGLKKMVEPQKMQNFLKKKRIVLSDPVIDPRQTWKQWFLRNMQFKDPPLVQRLSLPQQLRPQNRRFGKISHFFGKMALTPSSQVPSYKAATRTQGDSFHNKYNQANSQQLQMNSVA